MSGLDLLTSRDLKEKRKPSSQWRNKWRLRGVRVRLPASGVTLTPGIHWGPGTFPSKEIAEQRALEKLRDSWLTFEDDTPAVLFRRYFEWLGSHPVEEGE